MTDPRWEQFEIRYNVQMLRERLGKGVNGEVKGTNRRTAVEFFEYPEPYARERHAYQLLQAEQIFKIYGHQIPELIRYDDDLLAIEMTIVRPPYLLDFAGAYPEEHAPDFPPEVWEERNLYWADLFGDRWPQVERLRDEFRRLLGLVLTDFNHGNITFAEPSDR